VVEEGLVQDGVLDGRGWWVGLGTPRGKNLGAVVVEGTLKEGVGDVGRGGGGGGGTGEGQK